MYDEEVTKDDIPNDESQDKEVQEEVVQESGKNRSIFNLLLVGLIILMIILFAVEIMEMRNIDSNVPDITQPSGAVTPAPIELSTDLFESEKMYLLFSDITISITKEDVREYYETLTSDISKFKKLDMAKHIPSESTFEVFYPSTKTSIFLYDDVNDNSVHCTVVTQGAIIGHYLIPSEYYGNLFNIIYSSPELAAHTAGKLVEDVATFVKHNNIIAVQLSEEHVITANASKVKTFEAMIKGKEFTSIVYTINAESCIVIFYENYQYYVFVTDMEGNIIQQNYYQHYQLLDGDYIYCYNDEFHFVEDNFVMNENIFALKVVDLG